MTISATTQGLRPGVCTSTNRPAVPFDGMLIYETDTNRVAVYDTNAWVYKTPASTVGSVLQVVSTTKTDTFSTTSTSFTDVTGLSVTITPRFSTSRILVIASVTGSGDNGVASGHIRMVRGSTGVFVGDASGSRVQGFRIETPLSSAPLTYGLSFLDSPATTSAVTYAIQARTVATGSFYINRSKSDTDNADNPRSASSITVMEIAQ